MDNQDAPLSELCSICHIHPPKYRCPRCSTRTCSLPCTKRHKLWSQCSGVRDPAAYLRRSELATESAFDRDFNFITGIERSLERAEREVEDRGIELSRGAVRDGVGVGEVGESGAGAGAGPAGRKRKLPGQGLVKGEAGFLRGAEAGAVRVVRAPRGMSRNKENSSRWHPKHKCLSWTVEWISATGEKTLRNCLETCPVAEAYDRVFPPPKEERPNADATKNEKEEQQEQTSASHEHSHIASATATTDSTETHSVQPASSEATGASSDPADKPQEHLIAPHRNLYFYLHRPRTTTKKPILIPLPPSATLAAALRERTVLEFPTIYLLPQSPESLSAEKDSASFMLEEEYLRTAAPEESADKSAESEAEEGDDTGLPGSSVNLEGVDEKKVLEVLKQDLFESVPEPADE